MSNKNDDFMNYVGYQIYGGGNDPAFSGQRQSAQNPQFNTVGSSTSTFTFTWWLIPVTILLVVFLLVFDLDFGLFFGGWLLQFLLFLFIWGNIRKDPMSYVKYEENIAVRKLYSQINILVVLGIVFLGLSIYLRAKDSEILKYFTLFFTLDCWCAAAIVSSDIPKVQKACREIEDQKRAERASDEEWIKAAAEIASKEDATKLENGGWICNKCGHVNNSYETSCVCGQSRLDN